ncbi:hypothetical protein CYQ88_00130 [Hydrogenovibrio sp. SC-1]|nr:hypothetical protein CYQ88_00130 [Hydrogenovibrio sp. SC-1]
MPYAEDMLERLYAIDVNQFDISQRVDELKGNHAWLFVLTMPVSALLLVILTLIGTFLSDQFILTFLVVAGLLFLIGKMLDNYEKKFKRQARIDIMQRIEKAEGEMGVIPHFKDFLPIKYRHLWQSLKKQNYVYIEQYVAALTLLQKHLDRDKFIRIWQLKYPETAPQQEEDEDYEEEVN